MTLDERSTNMGIPGQGTRLYGELGRILLAFIFIFGGLGKFGAWDQTAAYMTAKGLPIVPVLLAAAGIIELVGGLSILFGFYGKFFGTLLFLYLIPVTLIFHNFWSVTGPERAMQMMNFMKNMAIMGGLIQYALYEKSMEPHRGRTPLDFTQRQMGKAPLTS